MGFTKNFEQAIALCTGDLIALCDQDDVWLPDKLLRSEEALKAAPEAGLVFSDAEIVDENLRPLKGSLWEYIRFDTDLQRSFRRGKAFQILHRRTAVTGTTMVFRTALRDLILPIPDNIMFIHDGWIAAIVAAVSELAMIDKPLVKYRQHGAQQIGAQVKTYDDPLTVDGMRAGMQRQRNYALAIHTIETMIQRLSSRSSRYPVKNVIPGLMAELFHLRTRTSLSPQKFRRIPVVFRELITGRYHEYSRGLSSVAKDLFT